MKQGIPTAIQAAPLFTVDDHLHVQQQIEKCAHELWREGGCRDQSVWSDWLRAESEVLEQFVLAYDPRPSARAEPRRGPITGPKPLNQKTQILRHPPTNKSRKQIPTTMPL